MKQSYVCALIAMMVRAGGTGAPPHPRAFTPLWAAPASGRILLGPSQVWSITYHSWLTFVLLLWSCLIWIVRSRHHFAMLCSPFLLLYGVALCSLQYVWGMDLAPELPTRVGLMSLEQLGLVRPKYPCLDLGAKVKPSPCHPPPRGALPSPPLTACPRSSCSPSPSGCWCGSSSRRSC